jgi:hypothetical protein
VPRSRHRGLLARFLSQLAGERLEIAATAQQVEVDEMDSVQEIPALGRVLLIKDSP